MNWHVDPRAGLHVQTDGNPSFGVCAVIEPMPEFHDEARELAKEIAKLPALRAQRDELLEAVNGFLATWDTQAASNATSAAELRNIVKFALADLELARGNAEKDKA